MSGEEEAPGVQSNFVLLLLPLRSTKAGQEARHLCLSARMQVGGGGGGDAGRGGGRGRVPRLETCAQCQAIQAGLSLTMLRT